MSDICQLRVLLAAFEQRLEFGSLVDDIVRERPTGVQLLYSGPKYQAFQRPLPLMVDSSLLSDFEDLFNHTQVRGGLFFALYAGDVLISVF